MSLAVVIKKEATPEDPTWILAVDHNGKTYEIPLKGSKKAKVYALMESLKAAEFSTKIKKAPAWAAKIEVTFEVITPEKALGMLAAGAGAEDRDLNLSKMLQYVQIMRRNGWKVVPDAIVFDHRGRRINGKHRLFAIVTSGESQVVCVMRGFDPASQEAMDQGASRGPGAWLANKFPGIPHAESITSPILGMILTTATGYNNLADPTSYSAVCEMYLKDLLWLTKMISLDARQVVAILKRSEVQTALVIAHHFHPKAVNEMVVEMVDGSPRSGSPAKALRDFLMSLKVHGNTKTENKRDRLVIVLRAIMGHVEGEKFLRKTPKAEFNDVLSYFTNDRRNLIPDGVFDEKFAKKSGDPETRNRHEAA
jgi:hypothetical protein